MQPQQINATILWVCCKLAEILPRGQKLTTQPRYSSAYYVGAQKEYMQKTVTAVFRDQYHPIQQYSTQ